jgi:hypothetical protein
VRVVRPAGLVGALLGSCLSAADGATGLAEQPAVITNPSAATRAELLKIIRGALRNGQLMLADDALLSSSVILIERTRRVDPSGLLANGRELGRPEQFALVRRGEKCILIQSRTQARWILHQSWCRPVEPPMER